MTDRDDFTALQENIGAITADAVSSPDMPVEVFVKEAEGLLNWVQDDKELFLKVNFDWSIVDALSNQIGALRYAEAVWNNCRLVQKDALKLFTEVKAEAEDLREEALTAMDFAFFGNDELIRALQQIREGSSNADLVMDMTAIHDLGSRNIPLLEKINFDVTKLDTIASLGKRLAELLGASSNELLKNSNERILRDKAYTLLKKSVDLIRRCGKYVVRNDEIRLKGYISRYHQLVNRKKRTSTNQNTDVTEAVVA
jgi:hypothetical protein